MLERSVQRCLSDRGRARPGFVSSAWPGRWLCPVCGVPFSHEHVPLGSLRAVLRHVLRGAARLFDLHTRELAARGEVPRGVPGRLFPQ